MEARRRRIPEGLEQVLFWSLYWGVLLPPKASRGSPRAAQRAPDEPRPSRRTFEELLKTCFETTFEEILETRKTKEHEQRRHNNKQHVLVGPVFCSVKLFF